jgi:hypothetical protein
VNVLSSFGGDDIDKDITSGCGNGNRKDYTDDKDKLDEIFHLVGPPIVRCLVILKE